ncbi:MAG: DNA (cytosine-5)-methyltransferase 1 [Clostridium sp.]|jgi:DNA (cytosine-5)-methyltransferase 1
MYKLEKKSFSIFKDLDSIIKTGDKKILRNILNDFVNCICELYGIHKKIILQEIDYNLDVLNFLVKLGVIKNFDEIHKLEIILEKDFDVMMSVLSEYLVHNKMIDKSLMKYMDYYREKAVNVYYKDRESATVVDFFCGAGGMSLGFYQNGFKTLLANDIEDVCTETYSFNHSEIPKEKIITGDIKVIVDKIDDYISEKVDIIIGGPPCQGFSMANRQRIIDDSRNILYKYYVRGVEKLKPKFFVMENVKGMISVAEQVKEDFHNLEGTDYDVCYHVFNARDFSVPQNRERLIYIGVRSDISEKLNITAKAIIEEIEASAKGMKKYDLQDAIKDLRELQPLRKKNSTKSDTEESGKKIEYNRVKQCNEYVDLINQDFRSALIFNHKTRYNNDRDIEIFGRMMPGDNSSSERIADIMPYKSRSHMFKDKYYKLKLNEVCKTITAHMKFDCNMYIHPNQARGLTPREAARVQSYPDNYYFLGPFTKTYMQIGNSVPPLMSRRIAYILKKYI